MNKFPSRKEFTVLPKVAGLPEESESPTPEQNNVKDRNQSAGEPWSNLQKAGLVLKYCIQIGIIVTVLFFELRDWPQEPDVYNTDDPKETSRGGESYTCGCSLPASLGLGAAHEHPTVKKSLNICYEESSLETVTILMYSNSAAETIESAFQQFEPDKLTYNLIASGYRVTQEAYDLYGAIKNWSPIATDLRSLFIGGYPQPYALSRLDNQLLDFPRSYVRLYFQYYCRDCSLCDPDVVNKVWKGISENDESWASCFRWDSDQQEAKKERQTCREHDAYFGKCVVYPTETLPPNFAISRYLENFLSVPGINRSLDVYLDKVKHENCTVLEPSQLYLNISQVQKSSIKLNFVEINKTSILWTILFNTFPTLENKCADMGRVKVCSGTSVCNLFSHANSYDLKCLHMTNKSRCEQLMTRNKSGESTIDNTGSSNLWSRSNPKSWIQLECPEVRCESEELPYYVIWNMSAEMENDAFNRFLYRNSLSSDWAQRSGVCTTTYRDVYRVPGAHDHGTMFLQTECSPSNMSRYCWLTNRYHNITDTTDNWMDLDKLADSRFLKPDDYKRFICYRVKKKGYGRWFINTFGILFSWIGTVDLIWRSLTEKIKSWHSKKK